MTEYNIKDRTFQEILNKEGTDIKHPLWSIRLNMNVKYHPNLSDDKLKKLNVLFKETMTKAEKIIE